MVSPWANWEFQWLPFCLHPIDFSTSAETSQIPGPPSSLLPFSRSLSSSLLQLQQVSQHGTRNRHVYRQNVCVCTQIPGGGWGAKDQQFPKLLKGVYDLPQSEGTLLNYSKSFLTSFPNSSPYTYPILIPNSHLIQPLHYYQNYFSDYTREWQTMAQGPNPACFLSL